MRHMRLAVVGIVGMALLLGAGPAAGQGTPKERAKAFFQQGRENYDAGRFPEALAAFEQANAIMPHPLMLYNIGLVQEAMLDYPAAIGTYERFLASNPADRTDPEKRIARLRAEIQNTWTTVNLTTDPPGASIWVGSKATRPRGLTPAVLDLPAGNVTILLEKAGFQAVSRPFKLTARKPETLVVKLVPMLPMVAVRTAPAGARVSADGNAVGATPINVPLAVGRHAIVVQLDGFETVQREIDVLATHSAASPLIIDLQLSQSAPTGQLELVVDRPGVEVRIDGEARGTTPLPGLLTLTAGLHSLELRGDGVETYQEMVSIAVGEKTRARVDLGPPDPGGGGSGKLWGWLLMGTGGAAVLGGGVFAFMTLSADSDLQDCRSNDGCVRTSEEVGLADDVRGNALLTDVLLGTGVAIAATGVVIYLLSGDSEPAAGSSSAWGITPTAGGGSAAFGGFTF